MSFFVSTLPPPPPPIKVNLTVFVFQVFREGYDGFDVIVETVGSTDANWRQLLPGKTETALNINGVL